MIQCRTASRKNASKSCAWLRGRRCTTLLALALLCLQLAAYVGAQASWAARVHLRIRTELTLNWSLRQQGVELSGTLVDGAGRAVAEAPVSLAAVVAGGERLTAVATTNAQGYWQWAAELPALPVGSEVHVEANYAGDASRGDARAEQTFDIHKQLVLLEVESPQKRWITGGPLWTATVRAVLAGAPLAGAELEVLLDAKLWQRLHTDARGEVILQRPATALGALGPHKLLARTAETAERNAAQLAWTVELGGALEVKLQARAGGQDAVAPGQRSEAIAGAPPPPSASCGEGDWCLEGRVTLSGSQQPMANAAVSLFAAQRQLGALTTDQDGRFAAVLRGDALRKLLRQPQIDVVAQASMGQPWIDSGWSEVVTLQLPEPTRWVEWSGGATLALLVVAAALRQWLLRRRRDAQARQAEAEQAGIPAESFVPGTPAERPSRGLRGVILHGETGQPCAAVVALLRSDGQFLRLECPQGRLDVVDLQDGVYTLQVEVSEHELLAISLEIPHMGAFDGCELRPASCRAVVRGNLGLALRRMTGVGVDWGRETPRVVEPRWAQHARRGRVEIREAIRASEKALYGAHTSPAVVTEVKGALHRVEEAQK